LGLAMDSSPTRPRKKTYDGEDELVVKILFVGDTDVGKSSLLLRFLEDTFTESFTTTIGIDFKVKRMEVDGQKIKLQIWDSAGQERFRTITSNYYRKADGVFLVYDITQEKSFLNIRHWIKTVNQNDNNNRAIRMLLGNKCDFVEKRSVDTEKGCALAKEGGMDFLETSAKQSINVQEAFLAMVKKIQARPPPPSPSSSSPPSDSASLTTNQPIDFSDSPSQTPNNHAPSPGCC